MPTPYTTEDEIKDTSFGKPHVVILGAGASVAATPHGDANGFRLPTMSDFIETLGLDQILHDRKIDYEPNENFESLYSRLAKIEKHQSALGELEHSVRNYFSSLSLSSEPNLYDYLVLSLRKKDLIATFNWDPFLYQACYRNRLAAELPNVVYLHGNVATGYCLEHMKKGPPNAFCSTCQKSFTLSQLIYPITEKNYSDDPFISVEWQTIKRYLKNAFHLTIFGYGAPATDKEAVSLMKEAWGDTDHRELEQTEIIDIRDHDDLVELWSPFIHTHHYETHYSFETSWLAKHPRRTCEAAWQQNMECQFLEDNPFPKIKSLSDLHDWIRPLARFERQG